MLGALQGRIAISPVRLHLHALASNLANFMLTLTFLRPDIFRAAKLLIDKHGDDAPIRAAQRADELLEEGDVDGVAVWRRILEAIDELQRGRREGELLN